MDGEVQIKKQIVNQVSESRPKRLSARGEYINFIHKKFFFTEQNKEKFFDNYFMFGLIDIKIFYAIIYPILYIHIQSIRIIKKTKIM